MYIHNTTITLDEAEEAFDACPNADTAKAYALELIQYHADEMIGRDTLRQGLIKIADDLTGGLNDLGWMTTTEVRAI